jgi:hypothetical protein
VNTGTRYYYRVVPEFVTSSGRSLSAPGVVVDVTPTRKGSAVTDLCVAIVANDTADSIEASWTDPGGGEVVLYTAASPPSLPEGANVPTAACACGIAALGRRHQHRDGSWRQEVPMVASRCWVTPVTVNGDHAIIGRAVVATSIERVRDLKCEPFGNSIHLMWTWPAGADEVVISSWPTTQPARVTTMTLNHAQYRAHRTHVPSAAGSTTIEMFAQAHHEGAVLRSSTTREVVTAAITITYRITRNGLRGKGREAAIDITSQCELVLASVVVTHHARRVQPEVPEGGTTLLRVRNVHVSPMQPAALYVRVPREQGWLSVFVEEDGRVQVVHPPAHERRV